MSNSASQSRGTSSKLWDIRHLGRKCARAQSASRELHVFGNDSSVVAATTWNALDPPAALHSWPFHFHIREHAQVSAGLVRGRIAGAGIARHFRLISSACPAACWCKRHLIMGCKRLLLMQLDLVQAHAIDLTSTKHRRGETVSPLARRPLLTASSGPKTIWSVHFFADLHAFVTPVCPNMQSKPVPARATGHPGALHPHRPSQGSAS